MTENIHAVRVDIRGDKVGVSALSQSRRGSRFTLRKDKLLLPAGTPLERRQIIEQAVIEILRPRVRT